MPSNAEARQEKRFKPEKPVYGAVHPGSVSARLENISLSGMALIYFSSSDVPHPMRDIFLLVDGFVHVVRADEYSVVHDREIGGLSSNGHRLRRVGVRFQGRPLEWLVAGRNARQGKCVMVV